MIEHLDVDYIIDNLADEAGGYVSPPSEEGIAYTDLFFDVCRQFGIRYSKAIPKERFFVEEVTRVTWEQMKAKNPGEKAVIWPAFSAR